MWVTLHEVGGSSDAPIMDDEGFIEDDEEDSDTYPSEDKIIDDNDENDDDPKCRHMLHGAMVKMVGMNLPNINRRSCHPVSHNYFDIEAFQDAPFWNQMIQGINSDCASCYKRRKWKLKEHFDTVGGYKDVDFVERNPPRLQSEKVWGKVIDKHYTNAKWKRKSVQNSDNRGKQLYPSSHGSEPYSQKRFKEVKIKNEYKKMLDEVGVDESKVKQLECLDRVLGERRGHTQGVGRKVKIVAPYNIPTPLTNNVDLNAFSLQLTQQLSQQFNQQMQQMCMSQNPKTQPPPPVQFNIDLSQVQIPNRQVIYSDDGQSDDA
ncbi:unnamed protein product [Lactuca saligna]|uniref:Uncharacterized protein n=1 Tax=Lactuca saligna TaxID=75948 RepID=A0AA35XZR9_LACSI|nr:unnamed protein product [Lactuca saligna]